MRLRSQLLFVSLLTLALPWAGCQYVREFESALRQSQQDALADSAGAIATVLSQRPALLVRDPVQLVSVSHPADAIYATRLPSFVTLDGFVGDWDLDDADFRPLPGAHDAVYAAGIDQTDVWLYLRVRDADVIYERPGLADYDHVLIDYEDANGLEQQLLVATSAVGRIGVRRRVAGVWVGEPAAQAVWNQTTDGYQLEIRLRNRLIGARIGLTLVDVDDTGGGNAASVRRSASFTGKRPGQFLHRLPLLENALTGFQYSNRRLVVVDPNGWVIAAAGDTRISPDGDDQSSPLAEQLIRSIVSPGRKPDPLREARQGQLHSSEVINALSGRPDARWYSAEDDRTAIVVAAHPIRSDSGVLGAVVVEQTSEAILTLTDRALTRLMTLTLLATLIAVATLVGYATYLSFRIQRLSRAAEQAVSPEGTITPALPDVDSRDELGDLSRSFADLLSLLREHTDYLRSLAGKLSHELRTPLAVVQSSLDNLEALELPDDARVYAVRAREGSSRLRSILRAMSEASRVEQAIDHADAEDFDLRALVEGCSKGYQDVHRNRQFSIELEARSAPMHGVPELIAQMLDKLVDNAVDFSPDNGRIEIALRHDNAATCRLSVANEGASLPDKMQAQIFDSLVTLRSKTGDQPHMGFGLHIARLIAESHGGQIGCHNLPAQQGVEFFVLLPV